MYEGHTPDGLRRRGTEKGVVLDPSECNRSQHAVRSKSALDTALHAVIPFPALEPRVDTAGVKVSFRDLGCGQKVGNNEIV